ncbi:unnamed protein product [Haemonchus placei]|uniref:TGRM2 protein n=1 Tax=Haemonchus placei TaxID=6290 RepID=A0A0N4X3H2_HAEPC|nr:unnamed protein product [Haemonchus placei]
MEGYLTVGDMYNVREALVQSVLERMAPGFQHKQYLVRIGTMDVFVRLLDESREELEVQTNRLIPTLCKLMSDPNVDVREAATNTLAHVMLVFGEEISNSIQNRRLIPESKFLVMRAKVIRMTFENPERHVVRQVLNVSI